MKTKLPLTSSPTPSFALADGRGASRVRTFLLLVCLLVTIPPGLRAASGTWTNSTDNAWSDTASWLEGVIADGAGNTATFSNEAGAPVVVNLNSPRTIGNLEFLQGNSTITNNGLDAVNVLTLAGPAKPILFVPNGLTATIRRTSLAGANGFVVAGGGILSLIKDDPTPEQDPVDSEVGVAGNTISGDVILTNGSTLQIAQGYENARVIDVVLSNINSFTFYEGSTLNLVNDPSTSPNYGFMNANLSVPSGHSGTLVLPPRWTPGDETTGSGMTGTLTGAGTLNLQVRYVRGNIGGDWSAFSGLLNVSAVAGTDSQWRFGGAAGFPNAVVNLTGTVALNARYYPAPGGEVVIPIGALVSDNSLASLNGGNGGTTMVTFRIGALRTNTTDVDTFQGALWNNTGMRIIKEGAGTWVLAANSDHGGGTVISNGVLQVGDGFSELGSLGTGPVTNYGTLVFARAGTVTVAGAVRGSGSLSNAASGKIVLSGPNSHTGPTRIAAGEVVLGTGSQLSGSVNVADTAALGVRMVSAGWAVGVGSLAFGSGCVLNVDLGAFGNPTVTLLTNAGALAVNGSVTVNVAGAGLSPGTFTLLEYGSRSGGGGFALGTLPTDVTGATLNDDTVNKRLTLTVNSVFDPTLRWVGDAAGNWDVDNPANNVWRVMGSGQLTNFYNGAVVRFDDTATGTTNINLTAILTPASVLVENSILDYTFGGPGSLSGAAVLLKQGAGKLSFLNANDYTGGTFIGGGTLQVGDGVAAPTLAAAGAITNNGTLIFNSAADNTISGVISGSGRVVQAGPSLLTLSGANTHTGGVEVASGVTLINNNGAAIGGTGAPLLLKGGLVQLPADIFSGRQVIVASNSAVSSTTGNRRIDSPIIGTNVTFTLSNPSLLTLTADLNGFYGTLELASQTGQSLRFNAGGNSMLGSSNTLFYFNPAAGTTNVLFNRNAGDIQLGAIAGGPGRIEQQSTSGGSGLVNYIIGGLNTNTTFTGVINDAARVTAFAKVGTGTLTLNDVDLAHKGTMAVSGGVLALAGGTVNSRISTNVLLTAPGVLDLSAATDPNLRLGTGTPVQSLRGNGTIRGSVVLGANARLEPGGPNATGILTVTNAVTLAGVTTLELNRTNTPNCDGLTAASITGGGSLLVTNIGPANFAPGDTFQLFSRPVSGLTLSGSLPALPCANLQWTNKLAFDGSLAVIGTSCVNLTPTNITAVVVGGALDLSWPADQTGWTLLSNSVDMVNTSQWFPVPGSTTTNRVIITPEPSKANVFFRLRAP